LGGPLARLRVDGGLTRSRILMQTQADLLQAPVEVYVSPDATALGVAGLAASRGRAAPPAPRARRGPRGPPPRLRAACEPRRGRHATRRLAARRRGDDRPRPMTVEAVETPPTGGGGGRAGR